MTTKTIMYGIKNCDTIRKARNWLTEHNIDFDFFDYRKDELTLEQLKAFSAACGWSNLLNTRGTTYRQLAAQDKENLDENKALALMLAQPAMIKRPLVHHKGQYHLGFKPDQYQDIFSI
ncbi:ArsC family reductase [Rheinheimera sp. WS51]|uniref:ArsC family reductase n=1 Tax=Rheinheimera sp. WS51 TaxID=3425886 RepID=UPI003D8FAA89